MAGENVNVMLVRVTCFVGLVFGVMRLRVMITRKVERRRED